MKRKWRVAIVDDEPLAVDILVSYVQKTEALELVEASTQVFRVLSLVQAGEIDLVLLDVQMPELTGIQFMKIARQKARVILTTAYPDYALEGYDYNVVDYLLKPVSYERFCAAVQKLEERTPPLPAEEKRTDHFYIKSEYKLVRVEFNDIVYIESLRDYIAIHTVRHGKIMSLENLQQVEALLPAAGFARIHKSFVISLQKVEYIERNNVMVAGKSLPVGATFKENFLKRIGKS